MGVIIVIIILVLLMILLLKMTKKYRHNARKITFFFTGRASCTTFFGRQKRCLAHITEPSNDDYDNDESDHNGTFDDLGVKNDQKV